MEQLVPEASSARVRAALSAPPVRVAPAARGPVARTDREALRAVRRIRSFATGNAAIRPPTTDAGRARARPVRRRTSNTSSSGATRLKRRPAVSFAALRATCRTAGVAFPRARWAAVAREPGEAAVLLDQREVAEPVAQPGVAAVARAAARARAAAPARAAAAVDAARTPARLASRSTARCPAVRPVAVAAAAIRWSALSTASDLSSANAHPGSLAAVVP